MGLVRMAVGRTPRALIVAADLRIRVTPSAVSGRR